MMPKGTRARGRRVAGLWSVLVAAILLGLGGLPVGAAEQATGEVAPSPAAPMLFGLLLALATLVLFLGLWRVTSAIDPVEARLRRYGGSGAAPLPIPGDRQTSLPTRKPTSLGLRLAEALRGADLSWTATEYTLIMVGAAVGGFLLGAWRLGILGGLFFGVLCGYLPIWNLRRLNARRLKQFTLQLPDILTLMVGALRAGYGLAQALQILVDQLPEPGAGEFARVVRAMGLGVPVQDALKAMADRIGTNDVELVVTTIVVQHQVGGNLAETLATIAGTINDRLRIQREIGVMTSQQRLSGYVLVAMPIVIALLIALISPGYFKPFFEPGWARVLPYVAVGMQLLGFLLMRKIIDIEV